MKTFFENIILNSIDFEGYEVNPVTEFDKVQEIYKTFKIEYVHNNNKHLNEVYLFSEWLKCLPSCLSVPFYSYEILELAKKEGFNLNTELKEDNFLNDYWNNLAKAFFTLKDNL